jgi:hypothetical protein
MSFGREGQTADELTIWDLCIIATDRPAFKISEKIATFITCYHLVFYEICVFVVLYAE